MPYTLKNCTIDNCQKPVKYKGLCVTHYYRQYRTGDANWKPKQVKGVSKHREAGWYRYNNMKRRCYSPVCVDYPNYGARGIKMCDRWLGEYGFRNYIADVGQPPSKIHTLDRINNDGDYEPSNVRWADRTTQNRNKRNRNKTLNVFWWKTGKRWSVCVKRVHVGYFHDYDDAVKARNEYVLKTEGVL